MRMTPHEIQISSSLSSITIIRNDGQSYLDKVIVPAVAEYVLNELCIKRSSAGPRSASIVLLSIRQPASVYNSLRKRLRIPSSNIIDAYSEWYSFGEQKEEQQFSLGRTNRVSIGDWDSSSRTSELLAEYILDIFEEEKESSRILLIDSLALLFPGQEIFDELLNLSDRLLSKPNSGNDEQTKLTIVGILDQIQNHRAVVQFPESLNAICDTNVSVSQVENRKGKSATAHGSQPRNFVRLDIWRRKPSGRVHFETVTALVAWDEKCLSQLETKLNAADNSSTKQADAQDLAQTLSEHGLSFRVSLTSKEREVRAAAGLPYLHKDEKLADSALQLHPANLQVAEECSSTQWPERSSDDSADESEEEELFSEDV
ncbi:Elongator complex protein [Gracilaria domingensis]|nr:Elongator complex protein [Gracilaria domingensis]